MISVTAMMVFPNHKMGNGIAGCNLLAGLGISICRSRANHAGAGSRHGQNHVLCTCTRDLGSTLHLVHVGAMYGVPAYLPKGEISHTLSTTRSR